MGSPDHNHRANRHLVLEEQRRVITNELVTPADSLRDALACQRCNARMGDAVKDSERSLVAENPSREPLALKRAIGPDSLGTKRGDDFPQAIGPWCDNFAREQIGIDDRHAASPKMRRHRALAGCQPARKPEYCHDAFRAITQRAMTVSAQIIDGKAIAQEVRASVAIRAEAFLAKTGRQPGLHVVLVGEDPASVVYTRNKETAAKACGIHGVLHRLSASISEVEFRRHIQSLNLDPAIDGILVQLPLPKHLDEHALIHAIDPLKDVDGFHPLNVGALSLGGSHTGLFPCTPLGCMHLLDRCGIPLAGARAVVVGRSNIVGKPIAQMLLAKNATVTMAHSKTRDLPDVCREADVLIAAVGRPELIQGDWIKPGCAVIDVGINRVEGKLVGDVHFASASKVAAWITPVPGGVGPMTIAELLANTMTAAERSLDSTR